MDISKLITTKQTHSMDWDDFEKIVKETYNRPDYDYVAGEERTNRTAKVYEVGKYGVDDEERLEEFKNGGSYMYIAPDLLEDLARQGIIPTGEYVIKVSY